jgi:hypothetical protein
MVSAPLPPAIVSLPPAPTRKSSPAPPESVSPPSPVVCSDVNVGDQRAALRAAGIKAGEKQVGAGGRSP